MKIVVADGLPLRALELLRGEPSWNVVDLTATRGSLAEEIRDADALAVRSATRVTPELLTQAGKLQVIGRAGVGVDNIDLAAATQKGVLVMNTPGGNAISVAEHTFALLLALAHHITQADASMKLARWEKKKFTGTELRGKMLGLVGLGTIGAEVARIAVAYQMNVISYDPFVRRERAAEQNIRLVSFDDLMRKSDYISLHCSLTPETQRMINARSLALAKNGMRIVNCARGELIEESALLAALETGKVAGAGLDVFEVEPPGENSVARHPKVIATPHIAGSTEEAQEAVGRRVAEQVRDYLISGVVRNAVNMPAISSDEFKHLLPYVQLGEKLGSFLAQIAEKPMREIRISYDGGLAELNTHLVRNAVVKGALSHVLAEPINLVNAGNLATERGVEVVEMRSARRAAYSNSLGVSIGAGKKMVSVLGMIGVNGMPRVLGVNNIDVEAPLNGVILLIRNEDVPGVIGRVGTLLGEHRINIANFALGRTADAKDALGLVNVDQKVSAEMLEHLRQIPSIQLAQVIEIA
jgi:D-3-phosphoglycerate dehydrogenase / 2-oxoglutarate reductase